MNTNIVQISNLMAKLSEVTIQALEIFTISNNNELFKHLNSASKNLLYAHIAEVNKIEDAYNKRKEV